MNGKEVVFVSVPMAGKDDALIERAIQIAKRGYFQITNKNIKDAVFVNNHRGYEQIQIPDGSNASVVYLGEAIRKLGMCDAAIFGKGWRDARGCSIEHDVCEKYGIDIYEID